MSLVEPNWGVFLGGTKLGCFPWWETHQTPVPYEGAYTKQQELTKRHSTDVTLRVEIH